MSEITQSKKWNFHQVSCGREHSLAVLEDGKVFGWGGCGSGRIPPETPQYCTTPAVRSNGVEVRNDEKMLSVSAGYGISLGVTKQGKVNIWGSNAIGLAGRLNAIDQVMPQPLSGLANIQCVSASEFQFAALDQDGKLYTWGLNSEGALGRAAQQLNSAPDVITDMPSITSLSVGRGHMLALDENGTIYAWGGNGAGQLGLGHLSSSAKPQANRLSHIAYKKVAAGTSHSLGLSIQGKVYAWGSNHHGQLGQRGARFSTEPLLVHLPEPIIDIASGMHFSVALGESGKVYAWGWNSHGQIGVGDTFDRYSPIKLKGIKQASSISAGETHAVAITSEGLFGWGNNTSSQLGKLDHQQLVAAQFF